MEENLMYLVQYMRSWTVSLLYKFGVSIISNPYFSLYFLINKVRCNLN